MSTNYESFKKLDSIKDDIVRHSMKSDCYLVYRNVNNARIYLRHILVKPNQALTIQLKAGEGVVPSTLGEALTIFESQNNALDK